MITNKAHNQVIRELERRHDVLRLRTEQRFEMERARWDAERTKLLDRIMLLAEKPPVGEYPEAVLPEENDVEAQPEAMVFDG